MGLGLRIGSRLEPRGNPPRTPRRREVFDRLNAAVEEALDDPLWKRLIDWGEEDGRMFLCLYPSEEPVEFSISEGGFLIVSAKTSSAGPGYHAMLVELLEKIEKPCGLAWDWDNEAREFQDETEFHSQHDYRTLQTEMAEWLRGLARAVLEDPDLQEVGISLPMEFRVAGPYFAISAMGFWTREWFEKLAGADAGRLMAFGAEFFPWWKREQDAVFWRNCGLVQGWVDVPWHVPTSEEEAALCQLALDCFERAREIDPQVPLPETEIEELQSLVEEEETRSDPPSPEGIGFRRRLMTRALSGGWTVDLPGFYYEDMEDDGETQVFWYGSHTVRASTLTCTAKDGSPAPTAHLLAEFAEEADEGEVFTMDDRGCVGRAQLAWHADQEEDASYWMLQGATVRPGQVCLMTICFEDPADKSWAVDTWKSAFRPADEDEHE